MKYKIYQVYRTNNKTNRYEYIGNNIENAKATFILYYLFSSDSIRLDHDIWKLAICEFESNIDYELKEYYTIDSLEMNRLKKKHPEYSYLLSSIPWEIDTIALNNKIYDTYLDLFYEHTSTNVDITNKKDLLIQELIHLFDLAVLKLQEVSNE